MNRASEGEKGVNGKTLMGLNCEQSTENTKYELEREIGEIRE